MLSTLIYLSVCSCEHVCGGMPSDAKALLCFPLFGFLTDSGRSYSTCPMRTARSKRIIPDQTLNIWYPQAGWFGITSVQQCLLWRLFYFLYMKTFTMRGRLEIISDRETQIFLEVLSLHVSQITRIVTKLPKNIQMWNIKYKKKGFLSLVEGWCSFFKPFFKTSLAKGLFWARKSPDKALF